MFTLCTVNQKYSQIKAAFEQNLILSKLNKDIKLCIQAVMNI